MALKRMQTWMKDPKGPEFFVDWGEALAHAALKIQLREPTRATDPKEYEGKKAMIDELRSLADKLRALELQRQKPATITGKLAEICGLIHEEIEKFPLLAADSNLSKWIDLWRTEPDTLDVLFEGRPALGSLYDRWRSFRTGPDGENSDAEKTRQAISNLRPFSKMTP